jgi:hypothetical protein
VTWYTSPRYRDHIEMAGATFRPIRSRLDYGDSAYNTQFRSAQAPPAYDASPSTSRTFSSSQSRATCSTLERSPHPFDPTPW